jgi:hypothetical protein
MSQTIYVRRKGNTLVPCAQVDEEALLSIPEGKDIAASLTRPRSSKQHRLFWAVLQHVVHNSDDYHKPEQVLTWLKIRLGYVEKIQFHGTQVWWQTKSISFNSMGQDEFSQFFNDSIDLICFEILPGMDPETLVAEAELSSGVNANEVRIKDGIRTA